MSTNTDDVLRDDALEAFLDQVVAIGQGEDREDARDEDDEDDELGPDLSDEERAQARQQANAMLSSRRLEPGDMDALERLFRVWMWLDQPTQAIAALDAHQARPRRILQSLKATEATDEIARHLQIRPGAAVLEITQLGYDVDGGLVEDAISWYRGDRYKYVGEIRG